jgi:hypothetical protein
MRRPKTPSAINSAPPSPIGNPTVSRMAPALRSHAHDRDRAAPTNKGDQADRIICTADKCHWWRMSAIGAEAVRPVLASVSAVGTSKIGWKAERRLLGTEALIAAVTCRAGGNPMTPKADFAAVSYAWRMKTLALVSARQKTKTPEQLAIAFSEVRVRCTCFGTAGLLYPSPQSHPGKLC